MFRYLDYEENGEFKKGGALILNLPPPPAALTECIPSSGAVLAAQRGDFGLFEKMGPNAQGSVTVDIFVAWILRIGDEKGQKKVDLILKNLKGGAKKRYEERLEALGALEEALPGGLQQLVSLLDFDLSGSITKDEIVAAQGGDFGMFEKMNPGPDGTITYHQLKNFFYELVTVKGIKRATLLITNLIAGAEKHLVEKQNLIDEAAAIEAHREAGALHDSDLAVIEEQFRDLDEEKSGSIVLAELIRKMPKNIYKQFQGNVVLKEEGRLDIDEFKAGISSFKREYGPEMLSYYLEWVRGITHGFDGRIPSALPEGVLPTYAALSRLSPDGSNEFKKEDIVQAQGGNFKIFEEMDRDETGYVSQEEEQPLLRPYSKPNSNSKP